MSWSRFWFTLWIALLALCLIKSVTGCAPEKDFEYHCVNWCTQEHEDQKDPGLIRCYENCEAWIRCVKEETE